MRKLFLVISVFICTMSVGQTLKWEQMYGGPGADYGYRVRACMDQGYIVAGSNGSSGPSDGYIVRTDSLGLTMWSKYYYGNNVDIFTSIKQLPDSGYILSGYSNSQGNGGYDGWAMRTDKNGDSLWSKYFGSSDWDFFYDVTPTYDSGFIFIGGTYGIGAGDEDLYLVKLDADGDTVWTKTFGGTRTDEGKAIVETGDSLITAVGFSMSIGDTLGESWILRMDGNGDTLYSRTIGYPQVADKALGVADMNAFQRFMVVGENSNNGDPDAYYSSFKYDGTLLFEDTTGRLGSHDFFSGIVTRPDGTFAALGSSDVLGSGNGDMFIFDAASFQSTQYGTTYNEQGYSIDLAHDNGYIVCGYTCGFSSFVPNVYLVKTDSFGLTTGVLGIREQPNNPLLGTTSIFPNPSNEKTTIMYDSFSSISGELEMDIFDVSGRLVMTIPSLQWQKTTSRNANCVVETSGFTDGIYMYTIHDNSSGKASGKFIVAH